MQHNFLAAQSTSISLVVRWLVARPLRKKGCLEYQMVTKTYLKPTFLPTYVTVVSVVTLVTLGTVVTIVTDNSDSSDRSNSKLNFPQNSRTKIV